MEIQLHPSLILQLNNVKVQPGTSDYSMVLGCDVTNPGSVLREVQLLYGKGINWSLRDGVSVWTPQMRRKSYK